MKTSSPELYGSQEDVSSTTFLKTKSDKATRPSATAIRRHHHIFPHNLLLCLAMFVIFGSSLSLGGVILVTSLDDSGPGTLRSAMIEARGLGGNQTIGFRSAGIISLNSPLPALNSIFNPVNLTIEGIKVHPANVIISGTSQTKAEISCVPFTGGIPFDQPIFFVGGNNALTLDGIGVSDANFAFFNDFGGTLTLFESDITKNTSGRFPVIDNRGTLEVKNCTISKNIANGAGVILNEPSGNLTIRDSVLNANAAVGDSKHFGGDSFGGAINNNGRLEMINSTVSGNVAKGADAGTFLTARGSGEAKLDDALNYYAIVDPNCRRTTFGDWLDLNGFDPTDGRPLFYDRAAHVAYMNNNDLGFGRDLTMLQRGDRVASWLANYSLTPPYADQNPLSADAAQRRDPGRGIAAVCMEYAPIEGSGRPEKVVKFFVFSGGLSGVGPDAPLQVSADLDGRGQKFVPQLCTTCHGGFLKTIPPSNPDDKPTLGDVIAMKAHFREFDLATNNFKFARNGTPIGDSSRSTASVGEQQQFYVLNQIVKENTDPPAAMRDLITKWYETGMIQNPDAVPDGWIHTPLPPPGLVPKDLYQRVIAKSCRGCHVALDAVDGHPDRSFNSFADFSALGNVQLSLSRVFNPGGSLRMPHAMTTFRNFWKTDREEHRATFLLDALLKLGANNPEVFMNPGGLAAGGGINNSGFLGATLIASTVAFNRVSDGIGFKTEKMQNGSIVVTALIPRVLGGGVFSQNSFTSLNSSIVATNLVDGKNIRFNDLDGNFFSNDYNLIGQRLSSSSSLIGNIGHTLIGVDPRLAPLMDNGGLTFTHALLPQSPAIDAGDNTVFNLVQTDQRGEGFSRKVDAVDIGAFEFNPAADCTVCHKGTLTLTFQCGSLEYRRHLDHGDTVGPCP